MVLGRVFAGMKGGAAGLSGGGRALGTEDPCGGSGVVVAGGLGKAGVAFGANLWKVAFLQVVLLGLERDTVSVVVVQLASMSIGVIFWVRNNDEGRVMPLRQVSAGGGGGVGGGSFGVGRS